jgi:hypothetical protein
MRDMYEGDFHLADDAFYNRQVEEATAKRDVAWRHWTAYVSPLGLDPYLQNAPYNHAVRAITGFAARLRTGFYGRKRKITAPAVNSTIMAIGTTIALATGTNPTKINGQDKLIPRLAQMMVGWKKEDPPTMKKLPVGIDVLEYISLCSLRPLATEHDKTAADLILIAFYYLLRIGKYTGKGSHNKTKQTVQFRLQRQPWHAQTTTAYCIRL